MAGAQKRTDRLVGYVAPRWALAASLSITGGCALAVSFDEGTTPSRVDESGIYRVRGTVSGLSNSKVTLALGDQRLEVGDGAFVFPSPLPDGARFAVTVPEDPFGHRCTLARAAGTIAGKDPDGVDVRCPSINAELAALTVVHCANFVSFPCSPSEPFEIAFARSTLTYEVVLNGPTLVQVTARPVEVASRLTMQGALYDPATRNSLTQLEVVSRTSVDVDVTAPDETTRLRYTIVLYPGQRP